MNAYDCRVGACPRLTLTRCYRKARVFHYIFDDSLYSLLLKNQDP